MNNAHSGSFMVIGAWPSARPGCVAITPQTFAYTAAR